MKEKLTVLALAAVTFSATAATVVWDGTSGDGLYTNGAHWVGGTAPTDDLTTDIAQLTGNTVDLDTDRSVNGLDIDTASTLTGSGTRLILGSGGLTGTEALTLSNNVTLRTGTVTTYASDITVDGATVEITTGSQGALGTGTITLDNGGAIAGYGQHVNMRDTTSIVLGSGGGTLANAHTRAFYGLENAVISGVGQLTLDGAGSDSYSGNSRIQLEGTGNTYEGGTLMQNKANVQVSGDGSLGLEGTKVTINDARMVTSSGINFGSRDFEIASDGGRISLNQKDSTIAGIISGSGALTIDGQARDDDNVAVGGSLTLSNAGNTHSGTKTIKDVTVLAGTTSAGFLGTGTVTLDNGTIEGGAGHMTLSGLTSIVLTENGGTLRHDAGSAVYGLNDIDITGDGQLTLAGPGDSSIGGNNRLQMTGINTYTGGTLLTDNVNAILYNPTGGTADQTLGLAGTTVTFDNGRLMSEVSVDYGTREFAIASGGGRLSLEGNTTTMGGTFTGSGDLLIDGYDRNISSEKGGTLNISSTGTLEGNVTIDGVNVQMSADNAFGTGAITLDNGAQLKNNGNETAPVLDNDMVIGSGGAELMAGWNQSLTLNGAFSGSGDLTIVADSGIVYINEDGTYNGLLTVDDGAKLGGNGALDGNLTIAAGGELVFSTTDTLDIAGDVALDSTFGVDDLIGIDSSIANGTYTLIGETASTFDYIENFGAENAYDLGDGKSAYFGNGSLNITVVPEPATLGLVAIFGGAVLFVRRRFKI